jgi:2-polyprenyl-3-methyl-5-hydroxy-6-metoxy-1,4-benzoquinol methylase
VSSSQQKSGEYFAVERREILPFLKGKSGLKILDVGCGVGATSAMLRKEGVASHCTGIEGSPYAAEIAKANLDDLLIADLNQPLHSLQIKHKFDLILCLDVLEHLVDPWARLKELRVLLSTGGLLLISLPNTRHHSVLRPLLLKGEWSYQEQGILDSTHLRFFTKSSALEMVKSCGFSVEATGFTGMPFGSKSWLANFLTFGLCKEFLIFQNLIVGKKIS